MKVVAGLLFSGLLVMGAIHGFAPVARADDKYAKFTGQDCPDLIALHLASSSPDKWNASTVNNCSTNHNVTVAINIYDDNGIFVAQCAEDDVLDFAFCQKAHDQPQGGSTDHVHWWDVNGPGETLWVQWQWFSTD